MENTNYNKKRYYQLVKKELMGIIFKEDYSELLNYSCQLFAHLHWVGRWDYFKLLEKFHKRKNEDPEFCVNFWLRDQVNLKLMTILESNLILLSPHPKSERLSSVIRLASATCESYLDHAEDNEQEDLIELENSMEEIYLLVQEILKEDESTWKDPTDFGELLDQWNWEIKDQYFELIEEFLDDSSNFLKFKKKYESLLKVAKEFESNSIFLEPNYQALGFSNFIHILIELFDRYQMDAEISPKVFKSWVRIIFLEMKNHYSSNTS